MLTVATRHRCTPRLCVCVCVCVHVCVYVCACVCVQAPARGVGRADREEHRGVGAVRHHLLRPGDLTLNNPHTHVCGATLKSLRAHVYAEQPTRARKGQAAVRMSVHQLFWPPNGVWCAYDLLVSMLNRANFRPTSTLPGASTLPRCLHTYHPYLRLCMALQHPVCRRIPCVLCVYVMRCVRVDKVAYPHHLTARASTCRLHAVLDYVHVDPHMYMHAYTHARVIVYLYVRACG
jgi:hypothetical protein